MIINIIIINIIIINIIIINKYNNDNNNYGCLFIKRHNQPQ